MPELLVVWLALLIQPDSSLTLGLLSDDLLVELQQEGVQRAVLPVPGGERLLAVDSVLRVVAAQDHQLVVDDLLPSFVRWGHAPSVLVVHVD